MKNTILILILSTFFSCNKNEPEDPVSVSPINGEHIVTIHEQRIPGDISGDLLDSTYLSSLTITGTMDSINVSSAAFDKGLYVLDRDTNDSLHYSLHWPPPASLLYGTINYSKNINKFNMRFVRATNHLGTTTYTITQQ